MVFADVNAKNQRGGTMGLETSALKFQPIVHITDAIARDGLIQRVFESPPTSAQLIIVTAPPGFGKTTLLAQMARRLEQSGTVTAWLNCDPPDRDPALFAEDLSAALAAASFEGLGSGMSTAEIVQSLGAEPVCLFIDCYELASSPELDATLEGLALLLPSHVRVVIASRIPPHMSLLRLQLEGHVRLINVDALRFTAAEVECLLKDYLPDVSIQAIAARAAGWPFVLQLVRLRVAVVGARGLLDDELALIPIQQVFEYLASQVLSAFDAQAREFLLEVSILDSIDQASADAVRQRSDSVEYIERLDAMKPIVVVGTRPLTASLHPLLREFLHSRLEREAGGRTAMLHARASRYFAERGATHAAVHHAVQAGRFADAAGIIEDAGGIRLLIDAGSGRVRALLQLLPHGVVQRYPRLRLMQGAQRLIEDNSVEAATEIQRIGDAIEAQAAMPLLDPELGRELAFARLLIEINDAEHSFRFSPWDRLDAMYAEARACAFEDSRLLVIVLAIEILLLQRYGPLERAERRAHEAELLHLDGGFRYNVPWTWVYKARNACVRGHLQLAEDELLRGLRKDLDIFKYRQGSFDQLVHALLGKIYYDRGDIDRAFLHLESIHVAKLMTLLEIHIGAHVHYALCELARGNVARCLELLDGARQVAFEEGLPHLDVVAACHEVRILISIGRQPEAYRLADAVGLENVWGIAGEPMALPLIEVEAAAGACFELALTRGRVNEAHSIAQKIIGITRSGGRSLAEIDAHLLAVRACLASGDEACALFEMAAALALSERTGALQAFIDAGPEVLALLRHIVGRAEHPLRASAARVVAFRDGAVENRSVLEDVFTPRERDVLFGLVKGRSTKLIARDLLLSPETVKHHLKSIFAKLGVRSRDEAVSAARLRTLIS